MPELITGRNPVKESLVSGNRTFNKLLVSKTSHGKIITEIIRLAKKRGVPVHFVPPERLDKIAEASQGVALEASTTEYFSLEGLLNATKNEKRPVYVVLDGIEDPHNLGAIIRNAVAFGANGVIIGKWRSAQINETVLRASAGAVEHIRIARVTNIAEAVTELKENGVWVAGLENGNRNLSGESFGFPLAVVIGGEGSGIHRLVKERCDYLISIPQTGAVSSLNASCAAAVALYEIFKNRQSS
ncbi:MAG: 23S rRNA (guanosine(2251)-2'-O)-methyltransferase RlmB [Endomicrobiales bacterium]|nr:23S rRNA (guanosine(2251)-2'-O)-methyltransferase RlmB [Endomicrobiales bacterium]